MIRAFPASTIVLAVLAAACPAQLPAGFDERWSETRDSWRKQVQDEGIVGSSLMFLHRGKLISLEHEGLADIATKRKVDAKTIYHWASITKTLTGIAIMNLERRGKLSLEDPIVKYLPELRRVHNPFGPMEAITLRQLLTHTAGFRGPTWPWGGNEAWHPHEPTTWDQIVAMLPYTKIQFKPGTQVSYSNPAIIFLGRVIEILTGEDYETHVEKNIFRPLRMHSSYFDLTPYHLLPHRSNNYTFKDQDPLANGLDFDTGITVSNGGWNAPLPDVARYVAFLTGHAPAEKLRETILPRRDLLQMWKEHAVRGKGEGDDKQAMGLVFFLYGEGSRRLVGHTGGQKAFVTFLLFHPESGAAAVAAFNSTGRTRSRAGQVSSNLQSTLKKRVFPLFFKP